MEQLLVGYRGASEASNIPVRTLRSLVKNRVLPIIRGGHRSVFFRPSDIERALKKRTTREIG